MNTRFVAVYEGHNGVGTHHIVDRKTGLTVPVQPIFDGPLGGRVYGGVGDVWRELAAWLNSLLPAHGSDLSNGGWGDADGVALVAAEAVGARANNAV